MSRRGEALRAFLGDAGWAGANVAPLAADASFRRYDRVRLKDRDAVLMDAPPPQEDVRPFATIGRYLTQLGFSAPRIMAEDTRLGFLLLEDLGDATYTRMLDDGADAEPMYALAIDVLIRLHELASADNAPIGIPPYDLSALLAEADLFVDWYLPNVLDTPLSDDTRAAWGQQWRSVLGSVADRPETLVLRDYHVDNLMWLPNRPSTARCGLLDFQDAVLGPRAYDVMSLLEDARRDIDPDLSAQMIARYLASNPAIEPNSFASDIAVLGAGRHAKVIGIFTRLSRRDGKHDYLHHIPRVWRLLENALRHPALSGVADWIDLHVPKSARRVPSRPETG